MPPQNVLADNDATLAALAESLSQGRLVVLHPRLKAGFQAGAPLVHYGGNVFVFPFGLWPSGDPCIFLNGFSQREGHDYMRYQVGDESSAACAIAFLFEIRPGDVVLSNYKPA